MVGRARRNQPCFLQDKRFACLLELKCDLTRIKANMENVQDVRDLSWLYLLELRLVRALVLEHLIRPGKKEGTRY